MKKYKTIFHLDMDAFFASIEIVKNPLLKGKPVIVGGSVERRGVVSTCSYEARAFGVRSAMSMSEAHRKCPQGVFLEGSYSLYREVSHSIMEIIHSYTPIVEVVSIDEAYIDATAIVDNYEGAENLARHIKEAIFQKTQLTCSIGIASSKLVAKIASDRNKPNGICLVHPGEEESFLAPLDVDKLPGIGEQTRSFLAQEEILSIGDLQRVPLDRLLLRHGTYGYYYFQASRGKDHREVEPEDSDPKSIGAETTFEEDRDDREFLVGALKELVKTAQRRLKEQRMWTGAICLKLRDGTFKTTTHSQSLPSETQDLHKIQRAAIALLDKVYSGEVPLRLIGISFRSLKTPYWQPSLWDWVKQ